MEDSHPLPSESQTRTELWADHERRNRLQPRGDCNKPRPRSMRCVRCIITTHIIAIVYATTCMTVDLCP